MPSDTIAPQPAGQPPGIRGGRIQAEAAVDAHRPFAPEPRTKPAGYIETLRHLYSNPINLLTEEHYKRDFIRNRKFGLSAVFLNDPGLVRHVFVDNPGNYSIDPIRKLLLFRNFGKGMATVDGEEWRLSRSTATPHFTRAYLADYADDISRIVAHSLETTEPGRAFDLFDLISRITFESAMKCFFSAAKDSSFLPIMKSNTVYMEQNLALDLMDLWRAPYFVPRILKRSAASHGRFMRRRMAAMFDRRSIGGCPAGHARSDLLDSLVGYSNACGGTRKGKKWALDNMGTMLGASFDTTGQSVSWTIRFLSQSPESLRRVRAEIDAGRHDGKPPHRWGSVLPYTLAAFREALRIYPVIPAFSRIALGEDTIGSHKIGKGEFVVANIWAMHRNRRIWDQADAFIPDRFMPGGEAAENSGWYMPFGTGRRTCIGRQYAEIEAVIILAILLRRYDFAPADEEQAKPVWRGTLRCESPMHFVVRERQTSGSREKR
ncbi:MAG: cytochrome P450 [Rhizobiaceae bacterium]